MPDKIDFMPVDIDFEPVEETPAPSGWQRVQSLMQTAGNIVSEGGPAVLGGIAGGMVAGPPGAFLGAAGGEALKRAIWAAGGRPQGGLKEAAAAEVAAGLEGLVASPKGLPKIVAGQFPQAAAAKAAGGVMEVPAEVTVARRQAYIAGEKAGMEQAAKATMAEGTPASRRVFAETSKELRTSSFKAMGAKATEKYNKLREILNTPENIETVAVGVDEAGAPVMAQMASPFKDWAAVKEELRPLFLAAQEGPLGAPKLFKDVMSSPNVIPIEQADRFLSELKRAARVAFPGDVDSRRALNKVVSKAITEKLDPAIKALNGGDEALAALNEGRGIVRLQHAIHDTRLARGVATTIEGGGKVLPVVNNPMKLSSYISQTGDKGKNLLRHRLFSEIYSAAKLPDGQIDPGRWAKLWHQISDESKAMLYEPRQIRLGDALAQRGLDVANLLKREKDLLTALPPKSPSAVQRLAHYGRVIAPWLLAVGSAGYVGSKINSLRELMSTEFGAR
jgi:hypothetical protein